MASELKTEELNGVQVENTAEGRSQLKLSPVHKRGTSLVSLGWKGNPLKKQKMRRDCYKAAAEWGKATRWGPLF